PVPERLKAVISPDRFHRVADRLLGTGRLGGGAVHAVSQLLGHTGPMTTLRYYCHLLDLSLGFYSLRPSSLVPANDEWLLRAVAIGKDARRKALARKQVIAPELTLIDSRHFRPTAALIVAHTPNMDRKLAEAHLLNAGAAR